MSLITINIKAYNDAKLDQILSLLATIGETMATQADIDALTAQVQKVQTEVMGAVQVLKDEIAALQNQNPALDLTALSSAVQALDDLNPDAVV